MSHCIDPKGKIASTATKCMFLSLKGFSSISVFTCRADAAEFILAAIRAGLKDGTDCNPEKIKVAWATGGKINEVTLDEFMVGFTVACELFYAAFGKKVPLNNETIEECLANYEEI